MKRLSIILLLLLFLGSCDKTPEKAFVYGQTQCADKWGYGANDAETITKLKIYFESKQIKVLSVSLSSTLGDLVVCQACICPTGRVFKVMVEESDIEKLMAEGFH
ncbi:MAG: hypothetical protein HYX40_02235 [Sphingobacteriales bacterium]|nr:hypothetical protein [Sphingobacteriales bacterium]